MGNLVTVKPPSFTTYIIETNNYCETKVGNETKKYHFST